jgi:hypothetical protein
MILSLGLELNTGLLEEKKKNLDDFQGGDWILQKLPAKIYNKATAVLAIPLMRHLNMTGSIKINERSKLKYLSNINSNSPLLKNRILKMLQEYGLKLLSLYCGCRACRKGIKNM